MRKGTVDRTHIRTSILAALLAAAAVFLSSCSTLGGTRSAVKSSVDYSDSRSWVCLGDDGGSAKQADCFLINPTVYVASGRKNNMYIADPSVRNTFISAVAEQGRIYSDSCTLYAPFYSQASIETYSLDKEEAQQYFDIAYSDVENAFLYYMKNCNRGRPLVLAGFSQGAEMCIRLLKDHGSDPAVKKVLVACYAIGWRLTDEDISQYPHLKPAQGEKDTGVIVCYDCETEDVKSSLVVPEGTKTRSINPLNWKTDDTPAGKTLNKGSLMNGDMTANLTGCYIDPVRGTLKVTDVTAKDYPAGPDCFGEGELHVYDYRFFFQNLKENVAVRINEY